jgi:hypothetical protein
VWYRPPRTNGKQELVPSGREALVAMMQPADLRYGDDSAVPRWLDGTRVSRAPRCIIFTRAPRQPLIWHANAPLSRRRPCRD